MNPVVVPGVLGDDPAEARLYYGQDVFDTLKALPAGSAQMVATSPPYWGLRDYGGEPQVWGGDAECDHDFELQRTDHVRTNPGGTGINRERGFDQLHETAHGFCRRCRAWQGHLGLEPTPQLFVDHLVLVFREVRRVLRDDGVVWLNLGDSYANDTKWGGSTGGKHVKALHGNTGVGRGRRCTGLKPKDLVGVPWMTALALRADGWYLRSDIIWHKPSCMPESALDRPTKSHEYIFLLAKNRDYFYDQKAIREGSGDWVDKDKRYAAGAEDCARGDEPSFSAVLGKPNTGLTRKSSTGRNRRSVWTINPKPYPGAHFATWPPDLVELMIKSGSAKGDTVLDPFSGSATTGMVALQLGRGYIGCDLQADYLELAKARLEGRAAPSEGSAEPDPIHDLFG